MAETLFRQWFVEEAGEDWGEGVFGDFVVVKRGGSPRPIQEYLSDTGLRWLKIIIFLILAILIVGCVEPPTRPSI
jgi:type I restriction enzyme S subunit